MKVYLVHGDTWFEGYGCRENVFGIYGTKKEAEIARKSNISENDFYAMLKNRRIMTADNFIAVCKALDITALELLTTVKCE